MADVAGVNGSYVLVGDRLEFKPHDPHRTNQHLLAVKATDEATTVALRARRVCCASVIAAVSEVTGVPVERITGRERTARIATSRHIALYLCRSLCGGSLRETGEPFGLDHTSVMHGVGKIAGMIAVDPDVAQAVIDARELLGGM